MNYKLTLSNIEWDTSDFSEEDELATGTCVPDLPSEIEMTDSELPFSAVVVAALKDSDTVNEYIHRSEDSNGKPSVLDRIRETIGEMVEDDTLCNWLEHIYGYTVTGFAWDVGICGD